VFSKWLKSLIRELVEDEISKQLQVIPLPEEIKMTLPKGSMQDLLMFFANVDKITRINIKLEYTTKLGTLEDIQSNDKDSIGDIIDFLDEIENLSGFPDDISHFRGVGCHVTGTKDEKSYSSYFGIVGHGRYSGETIKKQLRILNKNIKEKFPEFLI